MKPGMQNTKMKGKKKGLSKVWEFLEDKPTEHQKRILKSKMVRIAGWDSLRITRIRATRDSLWIMRIRTGRDSLWIVVVRIKAGRD